MPHNSAYRVYYEDTDLAGIVYYANYFKFIERARSDWVRALGIDQAALKQEAGLVFAVARVEADYKSPARFDDVIEVRTNLQKLSGARIILEQSIWREDALLFDSVITLVCLGDSGRPAKIPADIRRLMSS